MAKHIMYDPVTGETTVVEGEELKHEEIQPPQSQEERIKALEEALIELLMGG